MTNKDYSLLLSAIQTLESIREPFSPDLSRLVQELQKIEFIEYEQHGHRAPACRVLTFLETDVTYFAHDKQEDDRP